MAGAPFIVLGSSNCAILRAEIRCEVSAIDPAQIAVQIAFFDDDEPENPRRVGTLTFDDSQVITLTEILSTVSQKIDLLKS